MNSLQKCLVTMSGYDNGWEVAADGPDSVTLTSANHKAMATVCANPDGEGWKIHLPPSRLTEELSRISDGFKSAGTAFLAGSEKTLGNLLSNASRLARTLPDLPQQTYEQAVAEELFSLNKESGTTEVERLVRQRVGQNVYRANLMDYWGGACAVTGIAIPELLRASHSKPWSDCSTDADRLNVFNGFLLVANLDALFDRHLMTFAATGEAILTPTISKEVCLLLGTPNEMRLRWVSPAHEPFLSEHRERFRKLHQVPQA